MTATVVTPDTSAADAGRRPSIGRLTVVELRKMTDTRAGFWLLVVTGLIAVAMVVVQLFTGDGHERSFGPMFGQELALSGLLLPVLGILSMTGEWSQRTAVTTFTLVPIRGRVLAAKLLACAVLAALLVVVCLLAAALGNLLVGPLVDGAGSWTFEASMLGEGWLFQLVTVLSGAAFGLAFMNTPAAIVLYFLLPIVWATLNQFIDALRTATQWLDQQTTLTPLTTGQMAGEGWAKAAVTVGVWVVLPLIIGIVRLRRREVN